MNPSRILVAFALGLAALPAHAGVIVVDPAGGPGGGALLQAAVNAAQPGDILLLRDGDYTDADVLATKVLSLVADTPSGTVHLRRLTIAPPPGSSGTVLTRGLVITPPALVNAHPAAGLTFQGSFGTNISAWVEDCAVTASQLDWPTLGFPPSSAGPGIDILIVAASSVLRSSATGAPGFDAGVDPATGGGRGIQSALGSLTVCESVITGGRGGDGFGVGPLSTDGGSAIFVNGTVSVMGCTLQGGDEGANNGTAVKPGPGLELGTGLATVRDSTLLVGAIVDGGTATTPVVTPPGSSSLAFPAAARSLAVSSPVREGALATLDLAGETGDGVWLWVAQSASYKLLTSKQGSFMLGAPLPSPLFLGAITDPSGELQLQFHMPSLPNGIDGAVLYLQSVMTPSAGGTVMGSGSALLWIDSTL